MNDQERNELPSASNWLRYELCHGAFQLEREAIKLGVVPKEQSPQACRGERIHAVLAGEVVADLEENEKTSAEFLSERALAEVERIFGRKDIPCVNEQRLWLEVDGKKAASGRFDRVYFTEKLALVQDFKTGWREIGSAETNSQLKVLAVLVGIALPSVEEIIVELVSGPHGITMARYNLEALSQAYREILVTLRAINNPNAAFSPSEAACHFCPAISICQAVKDRILPVAKLQYSALPDGDRAAKLLDECELLERHIDSIRAYYKERMECDPSYQIPGWNLVPGAQRRELTNALAARNRLEEFIPAEQLDQLAYYSIPNLQTLLAKTLKLKAKEAAAKLGEILGDLMQRKEGALVLKRVKGEARVAALME